MTNLEKWTDFFLKAGLAKEVANNYAHSFTENRIQMSMLPDLNKEYLKDMGIFWMGDIILILKQAKTVQERGTSALGGKRKAADDFDDEKPVIKRNLTVMSPKMRSDIKPVVRKSVMTDESDEEPSPVRKKPAKEPQRTTFVLKNSVNDREVPQRISTSNKAIKRTIETKNSSIFDRLGSKSSDGSPKPTVKSSPVSASPQQPKNQRVLLVKKVPAKAVYASSNDSDVTDDDDDEKDEIGYTNTSTEKTVSFSAQDEIIEIASHKKGILKGRQKLQSRQNQQNIKARLGLKSPVKNASQALAKMRLQQSPRGGGTPTKPVISSLKSDEILRQQQKSKSVHERLYNAKKLQKSPQKTAAKLGLGIGRKVMVKPTSVGMQKQSAGQSVFDRLGFNKRK